MTRALSELRNSKDLPALKDALEALSGPSGPIKSHEFIDPSKKRITVFLELKWPLTDSEVRELGAYGFGNKVCLEFLLGPRVAANAEVLSA